MVFIIIAYAFDEQRHTALDNNEAHTAK